MEKRKIYTWSIRLGHNREIVAKITSYMQSHPANYCNQMNTLLELIYQAYTEFNSVETPEFNAIVNSLDRTLRALVDTDEESDEYVSIVFELCTAYERQSYIEGMKVGVREQFLYKTVIGIILMVFQNCQDMGQIAKRIQMVRL